VGPPAISQLRPGKQMPQAQVSITYGDATVDPLASSSAELPSPRARRSTAESYLEMLHSSLVKSVTGEYRMISPEVRVLAKRLNTLEAQVVSGECEGLSPELKSEIGQLLALTARHEKLAVAYQNVEGRVTDLYRVVQQGNEALEKSRLRRECLMDANHAVPGEDGDQHREKFEKSAARFLHTYGRLEARIQEYGIFGDETFLSIFRTLVTKGYEGVLREHKGSTAGERLREVEDNLSEPAREALRSIRWVYFKDIKMKNWSVFWTGAAAAMGVWMELQFATERPTDAVEMVIDRLGGAKEVLLNVAARCIGREAEEWILNLLNEGRKLYRTAYKLVRQVAPTVGDADPEQDPLARISAIRGDYEACADRFAEQIQGTREPPKETERKPDPEVDWVLQNALLEKRAARIRSMVMAVLLLGVLVGSASAVYSLALQPWMRVSYFTDGTKNRDPVVLKEGYLVKTPRGTVLVGVVTKNWDKWDRKGKRRAVKWLRKSYGDAKLVEILLRSEQGEILARWIDGRLRFARRKA
jgi:hypothetical protein